MSSIEGTRALVSVHDVMPDTLGRVERILALIERAGIAPVTLLVVPGAGWTSEGLARLRAFQTSGHELAGHGWVHRAERIAGLFHRVHAALISRDVAEHLALDPIGIQALIQRCHTWFVDRDLGHPALYCPPAWAMGRIPRAALASLPFKRYELLRGILSAQTGRMHPIPLVGYEADSAARAALIRFWNHINRRHAVTRRWLRVGIHPRDLDLRLADDLRRDLRALRRFASYADVDAGTDEGAPGPT